MHDLLYGENLPDAWDIQHGIRSIKVAVVDDGIRYTHPDLGYGIGPQYRVVDGREYNLPNTPGIINPPSDGGEHGTPVAGMIVAMTNNTDYVASIAGGWNTNEGVSLYDMKMVMNKGNEIIDWVNAWTFAARNTSSNGFGVHIISNSNSSLFYLEEMRRVVDFAYRMGVSQFSSKSNGNGNNWVSPADFDYHKIVSVGSYGIKKEGGNPAPWIPWVPSRARGDDLGGRSNYGYGLDIMAQGDNRNSPELQNNTISDNGGVTWYSHTSAAAPQVAAVGALILSQFSSVPSALYRDYEDGGNKAISWLAPEDVQGLLCISTRDLNFQYDAGVWDTTGYDAQTGYGMLRAGETLENMLPPNWLCHYSDIGGSDIATEIEYINDFVVFAPTDGEALLLPSRLGIREYKAVRHTVRRQFYLDELGWTKARSWSRGGRGTIGWSGALPISHPDNRNGNYQTGYCRVVGDAPNFFPFNYYNIRDISYKSDVITLETYVYQVTNKINDEYLGWFPCEPIDVKYRFTVWGEKTPDDVKEYALNNNNKFFIKCDVITLFGEKRVQINYEMTKPGPVKITIFDYLGNEVYSKDRKVWSPDGKNTISVPLDNFANGVYIVLIESGSSIGTGKFVYIY